MSDLIIYSKGKLKIQGVHLRLLQKEGPASALRRFRSIVIAASVDNHKCTGVHSLTYTL